MARQSNQQIQALVDDFVAQLSVLVHQSALDMVKEALGDSPATAPRRGPGRPRKTAAAPKRKAKRATKRGRRSADEVEALGQTVLTHVRSNPGQRLEEIGRELDIATKELKRPIAKLLEAGALRTEGQRRGTKYFTGGGRKRKATKKKKVTAKRKTAKRKTRKQTTKRK